MIAIVDTGGANLKSLSVAFARLGYEACVTADARTISSASHVVLPGVGSAGVAMRRIQNFGLFECLRSLQQPVLGVCLGFQLFYEHSSEGDVPCLGLLPGRVTRLTPVGQLPVPHMGWNQVIQTGDDPLFAGIEPGGCFYFVHSYRVADGPATLAYSEYGERIPAVARTRNFVGAQFHPEKSGVLGARFLQNFLRMGGV